MVFIINQRINVVDVYSNTQSKNEVKEVHLKNSLNLLWQLSFKSGILADWFHPTPNKTSFIVKIVRNIIIALAFCILCLMFIFEFTQLVIAVKNMTTIHSVTANLTWFLVFPLPFSIFLRFIIHRREIASFISDWDIFERAHTNNYSIDYQKTRRIKNGVFLSYCLMFILLFFAISKTILSKPEASYLLTHYPTLRQYFTSSFLLLVHHCAMVVTMVLAIVSEMVPPLVFWHCGVALKIVRSQIKQHFSFINLLKSGIINSTTNYKSISLKHSRKSQFINPLRKTWLLYEKIKCFVETANRLFGLVMIIGLLVNFFLFGLNFYTVLHALKLSNFETAFSFLIALIISAFRLITTNLLASQLQSSFDLLNSTLSSLISRNWHLMSKEECDVAELFLNRLRIVPLAARPLNLFPITPNILLTMLSLVISYVIVLLQSD